MLHAHDRHNPLLESGQQPLFAELASLPKAGQGPAGGKLTSLGSSAKPQAAPANEPQITNSDDHLYAAKLLAKKLRNRRAPPGQRKRTGIAICRHLIALLDEAD